MKMAKNTSLATMSLASNVLFASAFLTPPRSTAWSKPAFSSSRSTSFAIALAMM